MGAGVVRTYSGVTIFRVGVAVGGTRVVVVLLLVLGMVTLASGVVLYRWRCCVS